MNYPPQGYSNSIVFFKAYTETQAFLSSYALPSSQDAEDSMCNMEKDDDSSSSSSVSDISGLSDLSNHDWEPSSGTMTWVQQQMVLGTNPRSILNELVPTEAQIPTHLDDVTLWKVIVISHNQFKAII